jgi:muramidase (phage lysozyme)
MSVKPLLDFIAKYESRGDYNIVWGGIRKKDYPPKPLVEMTVQKVLDWQDSIDRKYRSEAAGRYQIMEDTLRGMLHVVDPDDLYDEETQDRLAIHLLRRRGLDRYLSGEMSIYSFGNSLAKEWASLPVVHGRKKGQSYYGGDGLNKSHVKVEDFLEVLREIKT